MQGFSKLVSVHQGKKFYIKLLATQPANTGTLKLSKPFSLFRGLQDKVASGLQNLVG